MKTEVIMRREIFGKPISQQSKSGMFSATDLVKAGNSFRIVNGIQSFQLFNYLKTKGAQEFIDELSHKYGGIKNVIVSPRRGTKGGHHWVHPLLFIDIALSIDTKLKIEVYEWLFDNLIKFRNDSGDSYKEMSAALWKRWNNHHTFPDFMKKVASHIKNNVVGVADWEVATEIQLQRRDKIHRSIITLSNVLDDPKQIVRLAIIEHTDLN